MLGVEGFGFWCKKKLVLMWMSFPPDSDAS